MFMTPCTLKICPRINGYGVTDALLISAKSCEIAYKCKWMVAIVLFLNLQQSMNPLLSTGSSS